MFDLLFAPLKKGKRAVNQFFIFFKVIGRVFDGLKEDALRVRDETNIATASPVMLPVHGQDRNMPRLAGESVEGYRTRLAMKGIIAEKGGLKDGILYALAALGYEQSVIEPFAFQDPERWAEFIIFLKGSQQSVRRLAPYRKHRPPPQKRGHGPRRGRRGRGGVPEGRHDRRLRGVLPALRLRHVRELLLHGGGGLRGGRRRANLSYLLLGAPLLRDYLHDGRREKLMSKTITAVGIEKIGRRLADSIDHAAYTLNGEPKTVEPFRRLVSADEVKIYVYFDDTVTGTVGDVQLVDKDGDVIAATDRVFEKPPSKGLYVAFKYKILEKETEVQTA